MLVLAERNRTFGYAAAASLALHAFVLLMNGPALRQSAAPPFEPPLTAHLVEEPEPKAEPAPVKPPPAPAPPAKRVVKPKPRPAPPPVVSAPSPIPAPPPPEEPMALPEGMDQSSPADVAVVAPPPLAAPAQAAPAAPAKAAPASDPAAELAGFRQRLVDVAVRYKRYPRIALDNAWTGDVVVRIEVAASGAVSSVKVKTSSGYEVLDAQALEMFRKAAPEVAVPASLRGKDFSVEVRAIYNLQDRPG
jgi:protein TonB